MVFFNGYKFKLSICMHNFKIPTYLKSFTENETPVETPIVYSDDEYTYSSYQKKRLII